MSVKREDQIVIVGAGVAGISAAHYLYTKGYENVLVLEADKRWGGRVRTEAFGSSLVELGANWIHGGSAANPVFNLANQREKELLHHNGRIHRLTRRKGFYYTTKGKCIDEDLGLQAFDKFFELERKATDLFFDESAPDESFADFISREYPRALSEFPEGCREEVESIFWGMTNYLNFHAGDQQDISSAKLYGSFWDIPGGDIKVPGGYINVFKPLFEEIQHLVLFDRRVTKIDTTGPKVVLTCESHINEGFKETVEASRVIVTVPLGVLKRHHEKLFVPSLPLEKANAISRLGFGRVGKIFLEFEAPFWAEGEEVIKIAWTKDELKSIKLPEEWYKHILGFDEVINNRRVLVSWISGDGAVVMESLSEEQLIQSLGNLLRQVTGDASLPNPISAKRTDWNSNPLYLGTYSFPKMDSKLPEDINILAEPLQDGRVLFAGEATSEKGYSTVHGARWSGIRAATQIMETKQ